MEKDVKLTKLSECAGCGAKVGAGELAKLLGGLPVNRDPDLLVGYDRSDDACVYRISEELAMVQTVDFFPPIVDDPFLFGQIAAANAISDVYAMGGEPKLALNLMCVADSMDDVTVREILRGGYSKAYEAGVIISGGHTIHGAEPIYGLAVTGFVDPTKVLTNAGARPGDVLILTKKLGVGILTTAGKADIGLVSEDLMQRLQLQMATLNKAARDVMVKYPVHGCTDVTGFSLMGHSYEMAQGSGCTLHIRADDVPYHEEAYPLAEMGFIPAGAYRNEEYASPGLAIRKEIPRALLDIFYDPQTSGGLLIAVPEAHAAALARSLRDRLPAARVIGYVTEKEEKDVVIE